MEFIDKPTAQLLAELLAAAGVRHVVVSPGSRCAPLVLVLSRSGNFDLKVIIDERSASFAGLAWLSHRASRRLLCAPPARRC